LKDVEKMWPARRCSYEKMAFRYRERCDLSQPVAESLADSPRGCHLAMLRFKVSPIGWLAPRVIVAQKKPPEGGF
jgi:hypothetical protein